MKRKHEDWMITALRISIGIVFLWFGLLKVAGYNPVYEIVFNTFPIFATDLGNIILGIGESLIGFGLIVNLFPRILHVLLVVHLLGTLMAFVTALEIMFAPHFPILTLSGEFVLKNIVLAMAGIVVLVHERLRRMR